MTSVFEFSTGIAGARHLAPHGQRESISRMINGLQGATLNIQFREKIYLYDGEAECVICAIKNINRETRTRRKVRVIFSVRIRRDDGMSEMPRGFSVYFFHNGFPNCIAGKISNGLHIRRSF